MRRTRRTPRNRRQEATVYVQVEPTKVETARDEKWWEDEAEENR